MIEKTSLDNRTRKMKKRNLRPALTFVWTLLSLVMIYFVNDIAPFGQKSILMSDLSAQYAPYLVTLRSKILSGNLLSYSMEIGMGKNLAGIFAYYLASPLNLITLLFPASHISDAIVIIIMLKLSLAGCFMTLFLDRKFHSNSKISILFGMIYALSSFPMTFAFNFIWLDGLALLPLIILLTESFHSDYRQGWKLFLCLVCLMVSNYYMAYMVGLFAFLYLIMLLWYEKRKPANTSEQPSPVKTVGWFILIAVCAALVCAVVLIPAGLDTLRNGDNSSALSVSMDPNFSLRLLLGRLFITHLPDLMVNQPIIYSSLLVFVLVVLFFLNEGVSSTLKKCALFSIIGAEFSFVFQPLNLLWHAFNEPNWFLYRYSYLFIFGTILLAYYAFLHLKTQKTRDFVIAFGAIFALLILAKSVGEADEGDVLFFQNLIFLALITLCLWAPTREKWPESLSNIKRAGFGILIPVVLVEVLLLSPKFTVGELWGATQNEQDFASDVEILQDLTEAIPDSTWGRMEQDGALNPNIESLSLSSYTGTQGIGCFCSMSNKQMQRFLKQLGYCANFNYTDIEHLHMIQPADSVLGVRYIVSKDDSIAGLVPLAQAEDGSFTIYENPYAVQIAMLAPSSAVSFDGYQLEKEVKEKDYFHFQEKWLASLTGMNADDLYLEKKIQFTAENAELEPEGVHSVTLSYNQRKDALNLEDIEEGTKNIRYYLRTNSSMPIILKSEVKVEQDMPMYFVIPFLMKNAPIKVYCNGKLIYDEPNSSYYSMILPLGQFEEGTKITLEVQCDDAAFGSFEPIVAWCDLNVLEDQMTRLSQGISEIDICDGHVLFHVDAEADQTVVTTVPFEEGWIVEVDGQEVDIQAYQDAFVCFQVSAGVHKVEMRFEAPGQRLGAITSLIGIVMSIALCVFLGKKPMKKDLDVSEVNEL